MQLSHNCNNDSIPLHCVNNTLELHGKIRNVNIPAPTKYVPFDTPHPAAV